jgi:hypothetical protein
MVTIPILGSDEMVVEMGRISQTDSLVSGKLRPLIQVMLLPALTLGQAAPVPAAPPKQVAQPSALPRVATYQIEALTTSQFGMQGGGANLMQMMLGGGPTMGITTNRTLELRLESPQVVNNPTAEHRIPPALGMGAALPLTSVSQGRGEPPTWKDDPISEGKGRILLFRGCAQSAGADQPQIIPIKGLTAEQRSQMMAGLKALAAMPWAIDGSGTSGRWPNSDKDQPVPARGSLIGSHTVLSTYAPEISFQVTGSHDFLAPVALSTAAAGGAQVLSWQPVPTALGFQATAAGAGRQEGDVVMWTSSEAPRDDSFVPSDLQAPEAAQLIQRKVLLAPERTSCAISAEAMAAMPMAMVTLTAYGDTLRLSSPKGSPAWQLSLERRSSASRPLGQGLVMDGGGGTGPQPQEPPKRRGFNPLNLF